VLRLAFDSLHAGINVATPPPKVMKRQAMLLVGSKLGSVDNYAEQTFRDVLFEPRNAL
jgi:hypothetical protein